jgi:microcystin degradation protein MlrC
VASWRPIKNDLPRRRSVRLRFAGLLLTFLLPSTAVPNTIRVVAAGLRHESNTFCPVRTEERDFNLRRGDAVTRDEKWAEFLQNAGVEIIPTLRADALAYGPVARPTYEKLRDEIVEGVRRAGHVDGIYLDLHGAMVVDGYEDAQADFVRSIRKIVGTQTLIAASFDLHGNPSDALIAGLNIATAYRTAPHVDAIDTRVRAVELLLRAIKRRLTPKTVLIRVPILIPGEKGITAQEPLRSLYAQLPAISQKDGLLDASVFVGMALSDVPQASMSVTVVASGPKGKEAAKREAKQLANLLWKRRTELQFDVPTNEIDHAIESAKAAPEKTVFISDSGDNTTGGAAGDTTIVLERVLAHQVHDAVVAGIVDPAAVKDCQRAGVGAKIHLVVGGKVDTVSGKPLAIDGTVAYLSPPGQNLMYLYAPGLRRPAGQACVVDVEGVLVVFLNVRRSFTSPEDFRQVGIQPLHHKIVVVKLGYLFQALRDIAPRTIMALTPGFANLQLEKLPYKNLPRPIYPLDPNMQWQPGL